jgi:hypothetical protein
MKSRTTRCRRHGAGVGKLFRLVMCFDPTRPDPIRSHVRAGASWISL